MRLSTTHPARSILLDAVAIVSIVPLLLLGCHPGTTGERSSAFALADNAPWVRSELFFGQDRRDGTPISDDDWQAFVDREITPRFPAGFTVLSGEGQYRDGAGTIVREGARVLVVLVPTSDDVAADDALDAIADAWCDQFDQESVLRIDDSVLVTFETAP